jgi:hypothetical protein
VSGQELDRREIDDQLEYAGEMVERLPEISLPWTGEIIDLREPEKVADALDQVRNLKRALDELRSLLEGVLRLRSREQGVKTLHLEGGWKAVVSGGTRPEYDIDVLVERLEAAGLPSDRLDELVETVVSYKVDASVARQLAGANPAYKAALDEARTDVPAPWRVSVERERP